MRSMFRDSTAAVLAVALTLTSLNFGPAQAVPARESQAGKAVSVDLSARRRHYSRRHANNRAALQAFGAMVGLIGALIAADQARQHRRHHYYYDYPPPPPPRYYHRHRRYYYRY